MAPSSAGSRWWRPPPQGGWAGLLLSAGLAVGCAADDRLAGTEIDGNGRDPSLDALVVGYPPGPYGGAVGDVIRNYEFEGYVVPDAAVADGEQDFASLTMADLHDGPHPFVLLVMAETTCEGSRLTSEELAIEADRAGAAGGAVVEVLLDGDPDATGEWVRAYDLPVSAVYPLDPEFEQVVGGLEWAVIVDLTTQRIVWRDFGSTIAQGSTISVRGVDELVRRCGGAE